MTAFVQTLDGSLIDMMNPRADNICFREIARTLSRLHRYTGSTELPVSIGQHVLIGLAACSPEEAPYWLCHDNHEFLLNDKGAKQQDAHAKMAQELFGDSFGEIVRLAWNELCHRLDRAIWKAAGLAPPPPAICERIRQIDLIALRTEIRDFNGDRMHAGAWSPEIRATAPMRRTFRLRGIEAVASDLFTAFQLYLPKCPARSR